MDIYERSLARHRETRGKIEVRSRMRLESQDDLSLACSAGVARPCEEIAKNPAAAWDLTWKGRCFANDMKLAAVDAIAGAVTEPTAGRILPEAFDRPVAVHVARAAVEAAVRDGVCHA